MTAKFKSGDWVELINNTKLWQVVGEKTADGWYIIVDYNSKDYAGDIRPCSTAAREEDLIKSDVRVACVRLANNTSFLCGELSLAYVCTQNEAHLEVAYDINTKKIISVRILNSDLTQ